MHASIDHLLSFRDRQPLDAAIAAHIEQCPMCSAELHRLSQMRAQLQGLPQLEGPDTAWHEIQTRLAQRDRPRRALRSVAAAALVGLAVVVVVALREDRPQTAQHAPPVHVTSQSEASLGGRPVADLVEQSQHLESLLQALPERPRIERVSTAATIDTLQERIQWLDVQLSYAPDSSLSEAQTQRLWRERVELMDSLVKVRYAEAGQASF